MCVTFRYFLIGLSMINYSKRRTAKNHFRAEKDKIAPLTVGGQPYHQAVCRYQRVFVRLLSRFDTPPLTIALRIWHLVSEPALPHAGKAGSSW